MSQFTYAAMYRKALGAMNYTPERFGLMRVGDFFDALAGYNEAEDEKIKSIAEIIRTSTTLLWNTQQTEESAIKKPEQLWHFPWDKEEEEEEDDQGSAEVRKRTEDDLLTILKRQTEHGNSDKQSEG
jgi:hypothetical protein